MAKVRRKKSVRNTPPATPVVTSAVDKDERYHLKTYETHGVEFTRVDGREHKAECPFCGKAALSVNQDEGFFKCWGCSKGGNKYNFLQLYYDLRYTETTANQLKRLSKLRNLPVEAFEMAEVAYDSSSKRWLIPVRSREGSMVNLRHWNPDQKMEEGKKPFLMNTGGCCAHLYNLERLDNAPKVIICEGEWDCMAMEWMLLQNKEKNYSVVSAPGADIFKEDWAKHFIDKEVLIAYDHDEAGQRGTTKVADVLRKGTKCKGLKAIKWPESYVEKFDIRDYVGKNQKKPKKAFAQLKGMFASLELHDEKSLGLVRTTFKEVIKDYKKHIYLTQDMEDGLAIIIATVFTNVILDDPYCPVWMFLTGPSGCLEGDTQVLINRGGKTFPISIEHLYHKFHGGGSNGGYGARTWNTDIPTQVQQRSEEDGCIRLCTINDVVDSGKKEVFRLTLKDGKSIVATADHRFMTDLGWKRLGKLKKGDLVYANTGQGRGERKKKPHYLYTQGCKYHPFARQSMHRVLTHRLVYEANLNGVTFAEYVTALRTLPKKSAKFQFVDPSKPVHHKDENPFNNTVGNLEVCEDQVEHNAKHKFAKHVLYQTGLVEIQSIKKVGVRHTYDLCVDHPHNFVANGMVVHNSGKTLLIESVTDNHMVNCQDKITAATLVSNWKMPDGSDASLLPKIIGKTLAVKDWTVIMRLAQGEQEGIHSIMRVAYDGRVDSSSGQGITRTYPDPASGHDTCHFTFIAGVTNDIYLENRTSVGERSLKFQVFRNQDDTINLLKAASNNTVDGTSPETLLRYSANAFIEHKLSLPKIPAPKVSQEIQRRVEALSQISCIISANVHRKSGELLLRPAPTVGTRMVKTLIHLGQGLAFTHDKSIVDDECYRLMQTVALDTCYGWHRDVLLAIARKGNKGALRDELMLMAQAAGSTVHRCLEDLFELGAITFVAEGEYDDEKRAKKGQPPKRWYLSDHMQELFDIAKISVALDRFPIKGKRGAKKKSPPPPKHLLNGHSSSPPRKKTVKKKVSPKKVVKKSVKKKSVAKRS